MATNSYLFFLGSHPDISASEAWAVLEREDLKPQCLAANERFLHVSLAAALPADCIDRLGGTERIAEVIGSQSDVFSVTGVVAALDLEPDTKLNLGISGLGTSPEYPRRLGYDLKDFLKKEGHRVRVIVPKKKQQRLNTASVLFNRLTTLPHRELTVVQAAEQYLLTQTVQVQDITKYELRDTKRPTRDAKVGMLPPKLAQMMLNVALGEIQHHPEAQLKDRVVWDPFCGMGTLLQEGWLLGYQMHGSDASERMVRASQKNVAWLADHFQVQPKLRPEVRPHDATKTPPFSPLDAIVTEPVLGNPVSAPLPAELVARRVEELGTLYRDMLRKAHAVLPVGGVVLMALPAWRTSRKGSDFNLFPEAFLDDIEALGYHRAQLIPAELQTFYSPSDRRTLLYARPDALVGRELILWKKLP